MNAWQKWRWSVWSVAAVLVFFMALTAHGGLWQLLGVEHMRPFYADTVTTLAAAETWAEGGNPYTDNYRDPYRRPHSYGPWWLWLGKMGFERRDAWWMGTLTLLAFVAAAAAVAAPRTPGRAAVLFLCLSSPAVLYGMERGNSDLIIFVLLVGAAWWIGRPSRAGAAAASALLLSAAVLKFYPLISAGALLARRERVVRCVGWIALTALAFGLVGWLQQDHFRQALREAARPATIFAYGVPLTPVLWEKLAALRLWLLLGIVPVLVGGALLLWRGRQELWHLIPLHGGRAAAAAAGGASWALCFALTSNFPYRTVLLLVLLPFWADSSRSKIGPRLTALLVVGLWLVAPKYWLSLPDAVASEPLRRLVAVITGADQTIWYVLTSALGISLLGWLWRRWRDQSASS
jgi:hypothetical protein